MYPSTAFGVVLHLSLRCNRMGERQAHLHHPHSNISIKKQYIICNKQDDMIENGNSTKHIIADSSKVYFVDSQTLVFKFYIVCRTIFYISAVNHLLKFP